MSVQGMVHTVKLFPTSIRKRKSGKTCRKRRTKLRALVRTRKFVPGVSDGRIGRRCDDENMDYTSTGLRMIPSLFGIGGEFLVSEPFDG